MDGVFADMDAELARQAEGLFGAKVMRPSPDDAAAARETADPSGPTELPDPAAPVLKLQLSNRQQKRLWRHIETVENFWEKLAEIEPGVLARLAAVTAARQWEIIFLTKRPRSAGSTSQVQTQRWLESKGFTLPSVFVVQGSRGRIAASLDLDFVIDDRPENCLDVVVDSKARAVLVWREDEKLLPGTARRLGIGVVRSINECLDILEQVDTASSEKPGMMDRVMRLLGLREPARA